jgi:hypothetical protein
MTDVVTRPRGSGGGFDAARNGGSSHDFELVRSRPLVTLAPVVWLPLEIGDRALVRVGEAVAAGTPLAERSRDVTLVDTAPRGRPPLDAGPSAGLGLRSGEWLADAGGTLAGELVVHHESRWHVASGSPSDVIEAPAAGIVRDVRPGMGISLAVDGPALPGVAAVGGPARGKLEIVGGSDTELRPSGLDVGRAGTILVAGSRVDAETLTRARAMGIRGVVVAGLSDKDLRDFAASERRQSASVHRSAPFAVLVLDGALRRPLASPTMQILIASAGREVGLAADPPALLLGADAPPTRAVDAGYVRVVHGPLAGREGQWIGLGGMRRFRAGTYLEAGLVKLDEGAPVAIPLADLERFD